jgi:hypothetical protein
MTFAFNLASLANNVNSSGQLSLTTGVTGILPQANGGTGASSLASVAVTSLTAGTGISLSASVGAVTITNTGGLGGANVASTSSDVTLTNASNRVQAITMTTSGDKVILPDATTITTLGGPLFIIVNTGIYTFDVCTSDGYALGYLEAGESMTLALSSSASANANWITDKNGLVGLTVTQSVYSGLTASKATTNAYPIAKTVAVCALSSSSVLISYVDQATSDTKAVVATISGTTISYGTAVTVSAGTYQETFNVALSSTAAFIVSSTGDGASFLFNAAVISGTTITLSPATAAFTNVFFQTIRKLDSTRAIFTYTGGASNTTVRIAAHNGTSAITLGTAVNATSTSYFQASPYGGQKVDTVAIDANKFVIFYAGYSQVGTVSTTTITLGTRSALLALDGNNIFQATNYSITAYAYSATECGMIFVQENTGVVGQEGVFGAICNVSGTAATWGSIYKIDNVLHQNYLGQPSYNNGAGSVTGSLNIAWNITGVTSLDTTTAIVAFGFDNMVYKLNYIPTVGWKMTSKCSASNSPYGFSVAALSSTSAFMIGAQTFESNSVQNGSAAKQNAALIKIPT